MDWESVLACHGRWMLSLLLLTACTRTVYVPTTPVEHQVTEAGGFLWDLEAENGSLATPMVVTQDPMASGNAAIETTTPEAGRAVYALEIPTPGEFLVWARVKGPLPFADSFYVSVDDDPPDVFDVAKDSWSSCWQWMMVNGRDGDEPFTSNPRVLSLSAGAHDLIFSGRDPGTRLDRLVVTDDPEFEPDRTLPSCPNNHHPQVDAGPDLSASPNVPVHLQRAVTDDGIGVGAMTVEWHTVAGPASPSIAQPDAAQTTATFPTVGTYQLRLTASDGDLTAQDDLQVTISDTAPVDFPWLDLFDPLAEYHVAADGTENGAGTEDDPITLAAASSRADPGDQFWLHTGTYSGDFVLGRSGTQDRPIVFRAVTGERVTIDGGFQVDGECNWLWGLEITDPDGSAAESVKVMAAGTHLINNVIHHQKDKSGIGAWNKGPGQVIYGNILFHNGEGDNHPHNIYTQNSYQDYGYKYFVHNVLLDSAEVCDNCFNFHAYGECRDCEPILTGFWLEQNVVANGRFLVGGYNHPPENNVLQGNLFYASRVQFGYARPTQAEITGNYLGRSSLDLQWFWGDGETEYQQNASNVVTDNEIVNPDGPHVQFRTSAYLADGRSEGGPRIRATDVVDRNRYSSPFSATFFAGGSDHGTVDLAGWQAASIASGNGFDTTATEDAPPTTPKVFVLPNHYDPHRGFVVIFNWTPASQVSVELAPTVQLGEQYSLTPARDPFGSPPHSGVYGGPVSVPVPTDTELSVLLLTTLPTTP